MIHYDTITEKMRFVGKIINDNLSPEFYLAGGTALSLQIGHRASIDLDYFINSHIDTIELKKQILDIFVDKNIEFVFEQKDTLWCIVDGVKVSFISRFDNLLGEVSDVGDFRLVSIKDILLMKLSAICSREEYKDYFDLACISQITDVRSWVSWWQEVYKNSDPISFIIALSAIDQIPIITLDTRNEFINIKTQEILRKVNAEMSDLF